MNQLTDLPNIGITLSKKLNQIGVYTADELIELGSEKAIIKIATLKDSGACINMLFALEGAILGVRWHNLEINRKNELLEVFKRLKFNSI